MKKMFSRISGLVLISIGLVLLSSFFDAPPKAKSSFRMAYKQAGLTDRQAAAHLLSRFTYGATPGEVDAVVAQGLENWFTAQLTATNADDSLKQLLSSYDALNLTNPQIELIFPRGPAILRAAIKDGVVDKDSVKTDRKEYREKIQAYMREKGFKPEQELVRQFINQKIIRAAYSENQLQEVMTEFWFNHFNVSFTKPDCARFIPNYERDAIRPNALGHFADLLMSTAKSPAMLYYLDNFSSSGTNTNMEQQNNNRNGAFRKRFATNALNNDSALAKKGQNPKKGMGGLNENYAREVMELHTLGVDGGYTQSDVTQAAKILTGWTIYPMSNLYNNNAGARKALEQLGEEKMKERGFVHEGDFLFAINRHDNSEKVVLGKKFPSGHGYDEGVTLLTMLAHHPSTANFICKKIAVRFVNDTPPQSLIDKMVKTFKDKNGDIKEVLITMVSAPEFWSKEALREKTKSPFELAISSVRSLNAQVNQPYQIFNWVNKMGQKMYYYQAPTGFPDRGQYWINTGALLNRMNFGLALASNRIPGVKFDLLALNQHHEPESAEAALKIYSALFMPERNTDETTKRLVPLLTDPNLQQKVDEAAGKTVTAQQGSADAMQEQDMTMAANTDAQQMKKIKAKAVAKNNTPAATDMATTGGNNKYTLSQVIGIIIGSPEYQRK